MYTQELSIKNVLLQARQSTAPGYAVNGSEVRVTLNFVMREPTAHAIKESAAARRSGFNLKTFTGYLDRLFFSSNGSFCFTILAKERVNLKEGRYCYRTFNVDSGQVASLQVLA